MSSFIEILEKQVSPEWKEHVEHWHFVRAASERKLRGKPQREDDLQPPKYKKIEPGVKRYDEKKPESYLVRLQIESLTSYNNRIRLAVDGGESSKVLREYIGHLSRGGYTLDESKLPGPMRDTLSDFDGENASFNDFLSMAAWELLALGKCFVLTLPYPEGHEKSGQLYSKIIPRECVLDYAQKDGQLLFFKYYEKHCYYEGIERYEVDKIILITSESFITGYKKNGKFQIVSEEPNSFGFIPVSEAWLGNNAQSLIDSVATLQFVLMNAESILSQKIRLQALNILAVPDAPDIDTQLQGLTSQTYLRVPNGAFNPQWVAYPAAGLDADFRYIEWNLKRTYELAALRNKDTQQAQSGYSKSWDWMDTDAVLQIAATAIEDLMNDIFKVRFRLLNQPEPDTLFTIKRNFDPKNLLETLQVILQAFGIGIGATAEKKLKKLTRDSLREIGLQLTPQELKESDKEIEQADKLAPEITDILTAGIEEDEDTAEDED